MIEIYESRSPCSLRISENMADENSNNYQRRNGNENEDGNGNWPNNNGKINQRLRSFNEYSHPTRQATISCMVIPLGAGQFDIKPRSSNFFPNSRDVNKKVHTCI